MMPPPLRPESDGPKLIRKAIGHLNVGEIDGALDALAVWLDLDAQAQSDPILRELCQSAAQHCRNASMDIYASYK